MGPSGPAAVSVKPAAVNVAIIGASGYTGAELIRLLCVHPHVNITGLFAQRQAGQRLGDVFPHLGGVAGMGDREIEHFSVEQVAGSADIVFAALPHGQSAQVVASLLERGLRGLRVIDLSADFRLRDPAEYAAWYGSKEMPEHPAPALLARAVYGLPERYRAAIASAHLVACPGCYPTSAILALAPLLERGLIRAEGLIIDSKSGASGAGRSPGQATHLPEAGEGVRAYKVAGSHRHTCEIEQELLAAVRRGRAQGIAGAGTDDDTPLRLTFTPHLLPVSRGILTCAYATPTDTSRDPDAYRAALAQAYDGEPFVHVLAAGRLPDTAHVRAGNRAHVTAVYDERAGRVLALSAIDNLVKGASGQAVQCMNLMCGFDERTGLEHGPVFP